jgi:hypothetical protein
LLHGLSLSCCMSGSSLFTAATAAAVAAHTDPAAVHQWSAWTATGRRVVVAGVVAEAWAVTACRARAASGADEVDPTRT